MAESVSFGQAVRAWVSGRLFPHHPDLKGRPALKGHPGIPGIPGTAKFSGDAAPPAFTMCAQFDGE